MPGGGSSQAGAFGLVLTAFALLVAGLWPQTASAAGCHDPVPNPVGWLTDGTEGIFPGLPLTIADGSTAAHATLYCSDPGLFTRDVTLAPSLSVDAGFITQGGNTGIHVTMTFDDPSLSSPREARAWLFQEGTDFRVRLRTGSAFLSPGVLLLNQGRNAAFTMRHRPSDHKVIMSGGGETEEIDLLDLPTPLVSRSNTIEFGTGPIGTASVSRWSTLGLPRRPPLTADVQAPVNADGSSTFSAKRGVVPLKFTLAENGSRTCDLPAATLRLSRTGGAAPGPIDERDYSSPADTGPEFRVADCQYHYNLGSSILGPGSYLAEALIDGTVVGEARFDLK